MERTKTKRSKAPAKQVNYVQLSQIFGTEKIVFRFSQTEVYQVSWFSELSFITGERMTHNVQNHL